MSVKRFIVPRAALFFLALLLFALSECTAFERVLRLADMSTVSRKALVEELKGAGIVFVAERHNVRADHAAQLEVIRSLHNAGAALAIGLELRIKTASTPGLKERAGLKISNSPSLATGTTAGTSTRTYSCSPRNSRFPCLA